MAAEGTKGAGKPLCWEGRAPEIPALKPYWGKPAVRNFRGGDGNVGIIRSPVRAIASPDITPTIHQPSPPALISEQPLHILGQVHVERVDFLEPRVPQEEWASIRGHSVVGPEAAGMQAASLLQVCNALYFLTIDIHSGIQH